MSMASLILSKVKKRPILIGCIAGCSVIYMTRRRRQYRLPEGDIWLDMDLSRPLLKENPAIDLSFLSDEPNPPCTRDVVDALEMASKDQKVRGVLGRFSYQSWGGGYLACTQELRDAVRTFRDSIATPPADGSKDGKSRPKFCIAVADTFGEGGPAVGEYYLASAFDKVLVQKTGYVGLTGAATQQVFFKDFFDKYGIKPEVFNREEYKNFAESFTGTSYSEPSKMAMTSLFAGILDDVAEGISLSRGFNSVKDVHAIMRDCPMTAKEALSKNLIDGIMYAHDAESMVERVLDGKPLLPEDAPLPSSISEDSSSDAVISDGNGADAEALKALTAKRKMTTYAIEDARAAVKENNGKGCKRVSITDYIKVMRAKEAKADDIKKDGKKTLQYVAVINLVGSIVRHGHPESTVTSGKLCKRLLEASKDPRVGAVVLRIDSGGGSAIASDSIAAAVERVKMTGKPVVCSMGDVAASGGYLIASACDTIVAQPTTITGSIGVITLKVSFERLLKDWGIEVDSVDLSENHLALSPLKEFTNAQRDVVDKMVGEVYEDFVTRVANGRKLSVEEVLLSAKGRVWTGRQAKERGLVDELGGLKFAVGIAKKLACMPEDALTVKTYPVKPSLSQMFKRFRNSGDLTAELQSFGGLRSVVLALAEAVVGPETISSVSYAVTLLVSANRVVHGRVPGAVDRRGELEMDDIDMF